MHLIKHVWLFLVCVSMPFAESLDQVDPSRLEQGSMESRLRAVVQEVDVPPTDRDPAVLGVAEREARRMLAWYRQPEQVDEETRELNAAYTMGLVRLLGESRDPRLIQLLIDYSFMRKASNCSPGSHRPFWSRRRASVPHLPAH